MTEHRQKRTSRLRLRGGAGRVDGSLGGDGENGEGGSLSSTANFGNTELSPAGWNTVSHLRRAWARTRVRPFIGGPHRRGSVECKRRADHPRLTDAPQSRRRACLAFTRARAGGMVTTPLNALLRPIPHRAMNGVFRMFRARRISMRAIKWPATMGIGFLMMLSSYLAWERIPPDAPWSTGRLFVRLLDAPDDETAANVECIQARVRLLPATRLPAGEPAGCARPACRRVLRGGGGHHAGASWHRATLSRPVCRATTAGAVDTSVERSPMATCAGWFTR